MDLHTWGCIEPAGAEEFKCEVNIYIAEEHQHITAFLPCMSTDIQPSSTGKLLVHRDNSVIGEVLFT